MCEAIGKCDPPTSNPGENSVNENRLTKDRDYGTERQGFHFRASTTFGKRSRALKKLELVRREI